jgi:uncharacterized BrkB/YihY/UPF0761 family membrane protein
MLIKSLYSKPDVLTLLWVSYSSIIFFYSAEFTRAYADHFTGEVSATEVAVKKSDRLLTGNNLNIL